MKFFIDTANIEEIEELLPTGLVNGVTTNPSLIAKTGKNYIETMEKIANIVDGPVSAEVVAEDAEMMIKEGEFLAKISSNIVVKLPTNWEGIKACKKLTELNIKTNLTLCFSASQALLAAKAGATYISPFVGRLDDISVDGLGLITDIKKIFQNYDAIKTEILVASVRNPIHVVSAAKVGADIVTLPPSILKQMITHPLTDRGIEIFLSDWKKTGQKIIL